MSDPACLFAGGGTGGHLYPALAIAEQLRVRAPNTRVAFACSQRPLDAEILTASGEAFQPIAARPLSRKPRGLAELVFNWGSAVRAVRDTLREMKSAGASPRLVAMGGFVAAPAAMAARAERVPVTLVNLDAVPGLANRWIARRATDVVTAVPVEGRGWDVVGPIVRRAAMPPVEMTPAACRERFGLEPDRPTLLVVGGSQGATSINALLCHMATERPAVLTGWQVIHQAGPVAASHGPGVVDLTDAYAQAGIPAVVQPFLDPIGPCWGAADLTLARAGAGTVAEAWAARVPAVFFPYPYHADQHQARNAAPLAAAGAAVIRTDRVDPEANLTEHADELIKVFTNASVRTAMQSAYAALGPVEGAARVAERLLVW